MYVSVIRVLVQRMRKVVIFTILFLVSCSPVSSDTQESKKRVSQNGDKAMFSFSLHNAKAWKEFNQIYNTIQAEKNKKNFEKHYNRIDEWQLGQKKDNADADERKMISNLSFILNDEIKRKKEQLRNKPGRQPATDWFKSIKNHLKRMDAEIDVLQNISSDNDEIQTSIKLLNQSLRLSTVLIDVDREQIMQRRDAGDFELSEDQQEMLQATEKSINKAKSILKMQVINQ